MSLQAAIHRYARAEYEAEQAGRIKQAEARGRNLARAVHASPPLTKEASFMQNVATGAASIAIGGGILGLANAGLGALERGYRSLTEGKQKAQAVSQMLQVHPQLGREDKTKVLRAFDTLWKFNPDAATDPLTAGSFVEKTMQYGAVTTDEVKKLVDIRKAMRDAESKESIFSNVSAMGPLDVGAGLKGTM
ncbi:MAG: hypothetical protein KDB07_08135 [Planctomycetes bacterium]|nr:hypothetical protein [Planctomycetota bacterium]